MSATGPVLRDPESEAALLRCSAAMQGNLHISYRANCNEPATLLKTGS